MVYDHIAYSNTVILFMFGQETWQSVSIIISTVIIGIVLYRVRVSRLKDQKALLAQSELKQTELLAYSIENERKAKEEVKAANQVKRDLLARISREVRTPMNGVIGMASLLKETSLTNEQREYCQTIQTCGENLLAVINDILFEDILAHAKVDSGKAGFEKDFDLRNGIEEVLDVFTNKSIQTGVELVYQVDHQVPTVIITNGIWIRQILMNLVENAIRFTTRGEVLVKVDCIKVLGNNEMELAFEIHDTGTGIAEDKVTALTNLLVARDSSLESHVTNGAGLMLCKKLIALMGGAITIESILGKGTLVRFTLRVKSGIQPFRDHILHDMKGKKILIIDDNKASLNALRNQIEEWKLIPVTASSGKQALEVLMQSSDIDLVLTDMAMPEMDGASIAKAVRRELPNVPIVLLSAEGEESLAKYPGVFNSVVSKPVRQHLLSEHIFRNLKHLGETSTDKEQFSKQKLSPDFAKLYPLRILIAEDDRVNQKLIIRILSKLGYSADIAQNGKEVLEVVSHKNYDIVLMDVQMPEMNGLEATRMIRLCLTIQPIIIAMTANAMQGDREECINAGMDDYISKPVNIEELVILLEKSALQLKVKEE